MLIQIDVDELRSIALLSADAAAKMEESNNIINTVISKHDWKCPERTRIDETLENLKDNSSKLNSVFEDFSSNVIRMANNFTTYINNQIRDDVEYQDDIAGIISGFSGNVAVSSVSGGNNISSVTTSMESVSMNEANLSSLHGASHGISIMDFSLFSEENT